MEKIQNLLPAYYDFGFGGRYSMADPNALTIAVSAANACERIGLPESRIILAQAVIIISSPKSNEAVKALMK